MIKGARVRDDRQLRDIQDLIAKLESVNRQLSVPVRKIRAKRTAGATTGTPASSDSQAAEMPATSEGD